MSDEKSWVKHCIHLTGYICEEDVPISQCKLGVDISKGCPESCSSYRRPDDRYMGRKSRPDGEGVLME